MSKILIVDDQRPIRSSLADVLKIDEHQTLEASNGKEALDIIDKENVDLVFLDIKMDGMDGVEVLGRIGAMESPPPVIMMSGHGDIETAVDCLKKGAFDYMEKPLDLNRVLVSTKNALALQGLVQENVQLKRKKGRLKTKMIGSSKTMTELKSMIEKVAPTHSRVLILGENGTGKELIAQAIHENSSRNKGVFIEVNCAAIPGELIESELFGHEKGAFTGAQKMKKGQFELATEGTLFLDEIGDMSLKAQAKVLRALQEGIITRVGGEKTIKVNPRVLAATNKNLKTEIAEGRFREDLFHRISTIVISVPTLNERKEDIPELVAYFAKQLEEELGTQKEFSSGAIKALQEIQWTGNIRELRNMIERLLILSESPIQKEDVQKYAN